MRRVLAGAAVLALVLAGCGGGGGDKASDGAGDAAKAADCPLDALTNATKPVEISYWHAMTRANQDALQALTDEFNASQPDVKVTLSPAASYSDNFTRFKAGLTTKALPDLIQSDDTSLQQMIDSQAVVPAAACLTADGASTDDLVARVKNYYTVDGVLWGMPFNNSNLVLYYDKARFEKAGLDPANPPTTLEEVKAASEKIVQSGAAQYGISLKVDSPIYEHWLAKAGHTLVDNGNGRDDRATAVTFDDPTGVGLFQWIGDMTSARLALNTGSGGGIDHFLAVGTGQAAMTIDTSAALGTIAQVFAGGEYQDVRLGVGPMPGPASPDGGVLVGGAANYVVKAAAPEKQAAAYRFAKFLASPESQSKWAAATGYVPVSKGAVDLPPLREKYAAQPEYRVAYDQLFSGAENDATAGAVVGAYGSKGSGIRGAIIDAWAAVAEGRSPADAAAAQAARASDAAIAEYNARVG